MVELYDFATQAEAIAGYFPKSHEYHLRWSPEYVQDFPVALQGVELKWEKCKFVEASKDSIPDTHGVYCFCIHIGRPFPELVHIPIYIGKAAPNFLSERFKDYLKEQNDVKGRPKIVHFLNQYRNQVFFWWSQLPRIYVDAVEEHLLICCKPPCNSLFPDPNRLWGKAFD